MTCHTVSENVEQDVETVVNNMVYDDGTARFELTVGPDEHFWIRTLRKHSIRGIDADLPAEISDQDVQRAAEHRRLMKKHRAGSGRPAMGTMRPTEANLMVAPMLLVE
eukprot:symbB.v1.2.004476.t1/scaffold249.1/size274694/35